MSSVRLAVSAFLLSFAIHPVSAQLTLPAEKPIRIGRTPALSPDGTRICFGYQGNLWTVPVAGGPATRLTANDSYDINPRWSPDGKWIAFNSDREGGTQVFLIPSVGGPARQVTFHSVATTVGDWYPDGKSLVVTSSRNTRREAIYKLDVLTGRMKPIVVDEVKCLYPAVSPDGKWVAYTRGLLADTIRKGYRGSANYDIYVAPADGSGPGRRVTDSDKSDMWPSWSADSRTVFFSSERGGLSTIWKQPIDGGRPTQVVRNLADAIRFATASRDGKVLVFECDNHICTASTGGGPARDVSILCRTDERGPHTTYATFNGNSVSEFALSPDGKRIAFVVRGDIFVVTVAKGGEAKRLTDNPTRDQDVVWSPDGKTLVYSSNRTGEYKLYTVNVATKETKQVTTGGGIDSDPYYAPDGKWIGYLRGPMTSIRLVKPDGTGDQQIVAGPKIGEFRWSPDGKWLAFTRENDIRIRDVWAAHLEPDGAGLKAGKPVNITDHPGYNDRPRWFTDCSKLAFRSNRYRNRDVETINDQGRYGLYTVSLVKDKEKLDEDEDAEPKPETKDKKTGDKRDDKQDDKKDEKKEEKKPEVKLDPDEIERRAKSIHNPDEGIGTFEVSPDGKSAVLTSRSRAGGEIWVVATEGGSAQKVNGATENASGLQWAPDSSRFYYLSGGQVKWLPKGGGSGGSVAFTARMEIDRLVDYRAAFDEAWQTINDRYYDKNFHGADWKAVGQKYRDLLDDVSVRQDFNYLITQMFGELNSSHTGVFGGTSSRPARQTGYLGIRADADYDGPGVKVASVVRRSPAARDESRIKPGEFVLSVDGQDVRADSSFDRAMADKVGRTVTLLVNSTTDRNGARTVRIKPVSFGTWRDLLYEEWIDQRREIVSKASGGRIGYLHVEDMGDEARNRFERELFSIGQRTDAIVLDIRDNNGGDTHDSLLKILARNRKYFTFAPRTETPFPQPERAWTKPVVLLTNGGSLSDAECFTNGFKELKLGKVVGTPTMGWIIFTSGTALVDGTVIRIPHLGCFTLDGRDMENWGVPPDITVDNTPADAAAGRDPQLSRAVEEALHEVKR